MKTNESLAVKRIIPVRLNLALAVFYVAINVYQVLILPVFLLPHDGRWAWTLLPLVFLNNSYWSLLHEAIHDLLHPNRSTNARAGRLLSILFGSPFQILRLSHLLHHKLNRTPAEGTEYFDNTRTIKLRAAPGYYFQIFGGLYLMEVISPILFILPRRWIRYFASRYVPRDTVSAILIQNWLRPETSREIRIDGLATGSWLALGLYCYGQQHWPLLIAALAARGFFISFLDNVYHYATPVGDIFYAKNLSMPGPLEKLLLHFNLHGIHHLNPALPWVDLPTAFLAQPGQFQGRYFKAAGAQLRGPIAVQELAGAQKP